MKGVVYMDYLMQINSFIMSNLQNIILGMTGLIFIALIVFININIKLARLNSRYEKMMKGMDGVNIEKLLHEHIDEVRMSVRKVDHLTQECKDMKSNLEQCTQKVGIIRFNAFEDTGSDLSFSVAMLDAKDNGFVISSIFGRSESRSYAKPIENGQSKYFLTDEEKQALLHAQRKI